MRIEWISKGVVETGVDRGVLYLPTTNGVPWNGLIATVEKADDVLQTDLYFDGVRFAFTQSSEDFLVSIEAWAYPPEFDEYDGYVDDLETDQPRKIFGFSWRNDFGDGHLIHLVWNVTAAPTTKLYSSKSAEATLSSFTWDFSTTPKYVPNAKPAAHMVIDTNLAPEDALEALEAILYGDDTHAPRLPDPQEIIDLFLAHAVLVITDNGDGSWTATGPDDVVQMIDANRFEITWPSVISLSPVKYRVNTM